MNQFLSGGFAYMVKMIKALQIMVHLPMMRIIFPANVTTFVSILIPIVMFDVLENEYGLDTSLFVEYDDEKQEEL
jgi:hypothetical protein